MVVLAWVLFSGYTAYCARKEPFFKSCRTVFGLHWGRQVVADLYLGLCLAGGVIYLNEGSLLTTALWMVPILLLGNIGTLAYVALNYESLMRHFL